MKNFHSDHTSTLAELCRKFSNHFGISPVIAGFAPGRIEVLGNHTDYNEGFVLSSAINMGTYTLAAPIHSNKCNVWSANIIEEETVFDIATNIPVVTGNMWANYVRGVATGIFKLANIRDGFNAMIWGKVPVGAGLSSSAALEMSFGKTICALYNLQISNLQLAQIGQKAEHSYVGTKCGLLDQLTSLYGKANSLVFLDFRSFTVETVSLPQSCTFLVCNTGVKHTLVESEYNERHETCEASVPEFARILGRQIKALRDVTWEEFQQYGSQLPPLLARRSAHVIGENQRVIEARNSLLMGDIKNFGRLMYESHSSSIHNFENSCSELDFLVEQSRKLDGVIGARLSGGGFGGSVIVLVETPSATNVSAILNRAFEEHFNRPCEIQTIIPSDGATIIPVST